MGSKESVGVEVGSTQDTYVKTSTREYMLG